MSKNQGKVIEFKPRPRKNKKLKSVNYISPEKKELLCRREAKKNKQADRINSIKAIGLFLLICIILYILGPVIKSG